MLLSPGRRTSWDPADEPKEEMVLLQELNMREFAQHRADTPTTILPCGAVEEHGPHLPLGLDAMHAWELARRTAELRPCLVAPPLFYGLCRSSAQHAGTVGITGDTLRALVFDVGRSLWGQGVRALCILTGHAGGTHQATLAEAGEALLTATGLQVAVVCVLDLLEGAAQLIQCPDDSHAGEVETSLAMHLWPGLVKGSAPEEYPTFDRFLLTRDKLGHWPGGVWGDPSLATPEKGAALLRAEAEALARVIEALDRAVAEDA